MVPTTDFPLYKFDTVIDQPPDWGIFQTGRNCIFFCPGDHAFGCIYMGYACTCRSGRKCCPTGIGEKIKNLNLASFGNGVCNELGKPVPVGSLFRK